MYIAPRVLRILICCCKINPLLGGYTALEGVIKFPQGVPSRLSLLFDNEAKMRIICDLENLQNFRMSGKKEIFLWNLGGQFCVSQLEKKVKKMFLVRNVLIFDKTTFCRGEIELIIANHFQNVQSSPIRILHRGLRRGSLNYASEQ